MKYYSYVVSDDDIEITKLVYSEKEILDEFWVHWSTEMKGNGYSQLISKEACIDDWCTVHWATREDVYRFKKGFEGKEFVINDFNFQDPTFNLATVVCLNDSSVVIDRYVNLSLEMEKVDV
jgi:hypothetical protein